MPRIVNLGSRSLCGSSLNSFLLNRGGISSTIFSPVSKSSDISFIINHDSHGGTERNILFSFRVADMGNEAFLLHFVIHSSLIGFDSGKYISRLHFISNFLAPRFNVSFLHGRRKIRHLKFGVEGQSKASLLEFK